MAHHQVFYLSSSSKVPRGAHSKSEINKQWCHQILAFTLVAVNPERLLSLCACHNVEDDIDSQAPFKPGFLELGCARQTVTALSKDVPILTPKSVTISSTAEGTLQVQFKRGPVTFCGDPMQSQGSSEARGTSCNDRGRSWGDTTPKGGPTGREGR